MKIIITNQTLSIAPFISTHWNQIETMHVRDNSLLITLSSGDTVEVPKMTPDIIEKIFTAHAFYLEKHRGETREPKTQAPQSKGMEEDLTRQLSELTHQMSQALSGDIWKNMTALLQHDSNQAHAEDLPPEALKKMAMLAQMMGPEESAMLPDPEPHCNCHHCQILRALHGQQAHPESLASAEEEEPVLDQDLQFSQWEIAQLGDKLFHVTNRLDTTESYNVFLGDPVGCTCGNRGCEHVLAVLKS